MTNQPSSQPMADFDDDLDFVDDVGRDIAVIGMACDIAGASSPSAYWQRLAAGRDFAREFPATRAADAQAYLRALGVNPEESASEFRRGGWLDRIDCFDHEFFSLSPKEAKLMSPDQRLLLQTIYQSVENAGYAGERISGANAGLYVGWSGVQDYARAFELADASTPEFLIMGNSGSIMIGRVAYFLDLKGPALLVDTACSSSLVAIHLAVRALRGGECDVAIAAGVRLYFLPTQRSLRPGVGLRLLEGIDSPEGRCKTFDERADGAGIGEGVGSVMLKPLDAALADGDAVLAVIKGSASNQDGRSIGRSAPNATAQADVISAAWADGGVAPGTVTYLEAHGTGTRLGDPVELKGIQMAFNQRTAKRQFCGIGSVKPNIGHLDAAAGIAGFIKAVLALQHRTLPPSINFQKANTRIAFEESPVYVVDKARPWDDAGPLRCGVSAFGMNGSNCHVVLEEAPPAEVLPPEEGTAELFCLSALNDAALARLAAKYRHWLVEHPQARLSDICYSAALGRPHLPVRCALLVGNIDELAQKLQQLEADGGAPQESAESFGGPASAELSNLLLVQQAYLDGKRVDFEELYHGRRLRRVALPSYPFEPKRCWVDHHAAMNQPRAQLALDEAPPQAAQPATAEPFEAPDRTIFQICYGDRPDWLLEEHRIAQHSVVPGVALLDRVLQAASTRMGHASFRLAATFLAPCVVPDGEQRRLQLNLGHDGKFLIASRSTSEWTQHADGSVQPLDETRPAPENLSQLILEFAAGESIDVADLQKGRVDLGPHWQNCVSVARRGDEYLVHFRLPPELRDSQERHWLHPALMDNALNVLGQLFGSQLYLPLSLGQLDLFEPLPYEFYSHFRGLSQAQFEREAIRFNVRLLGMDGSVIGDVRDYTVKKVGDPAGRITALAEAEPALHRLAHVELGAARVEPKQSSGVRVIVSGADGLGADLATRCDDDVWVVLSDRDEHTAQHTSESTSQNTAGRRFSVDGTEADFRRVWSALAQQQTSVHRVVYVSEAAEESGSEPGRVIPASLDALVSLVKSLKHHAMERGLAVNVVASAADAVPPKRNSGIQLAAQRSKQDTAQTAGHSARLSARLSSAQTQGESAALFAFARCVQAEYPSWAVRCIGAADDVTAEAIDGELRAASSPDTVMLRDRRRFGLRLEPLPSSTAPLELDGPGAWVITGGLGGLGLATAEALVEEGARHLVLLGRSLPPRSDEDRALSAKQQHQLDLIGKLEAAGARVELQPADCSESSSLAKAFDAVRAQGTRICGVVHAAGVAGSGYLEGKSTEVFEGVCRPKIAGLRHLATLTAADDLDYFITYSSLASRVGIAGQTDYATANGYLDGWCRGAQGVAKRVVAINWPAWSEVGMAVDHGAVDDSFLFHPMTTAEGKRAFKTCLRGEAAEVLAGRVNRNFAPATSEWGVVLPDFLKSEVTRRENTQATGVPKQRHAAGGKDLESISSALVEIWKRLLDLEVVDVHRNFHSMGGDSLLATKLYREIDQIWPGIVDISDIFTDATVHAMAQRLHRQLNPNIEKTGSVEGILLQLSRGELSKQEAQVAIRRARGN